MAKRLEAGIAFSVRECEQLAPIIFRASRVVNSAELRDLAVTMSAVVPPQRPIVSDARPDTETWVTITEWLNSPTNSEPTQTPHTPPSARTVRRWCEAKRIPAKWDRGRWLVKADFRNTHP